MHLHVCSAPFGEELRQHLEGQQAQHHEPQDALKRHFDTSNAREAFFEVFLRFRRHGIGHSLLQKPGKSFSWRTYLSRSENCDRYQFGHRKNGLYEFQLEE